MMSLRHWSVMLFVATSVAALIAALLCTWSSTQKSFDDGAAGVVDSFVEGVIPGQLSIDDTSVCPVRGEQIVGVGRGRSVYAIVDATNKGNGELRITDSTTGQVLLVRKIRDCYAEDEVWSEYAGEWLYYYFADFDKDGLLDIEISGAEILRSEKEILGVTIIRERYFLTSADGYQPRDSG